MSDFISTSILLDEGSNVSISAVNFMICTVVSVLLGILIAAVYMYKNDYQKEFVVTLALLPAIVQMVIMLVNGNLGTGVAVMGAFSLVRFRSIPGTAREIMNIFLAMAVGLATGMGYLGIAFLFTVVTCILGLVLMASPMGERPCNERFLKIVIPEALDYTEVFDDIFSEFTDSVNLVKVRTSNMGSLYKLEYRIKMKKNISEKKMIDALRCRNGNLESSCGMAAGGREEML
jgi:uncharacterized membrane protein YhiD involved in acid resistance